MAKRKKTLTKTIQSFWNKYIKFQFSYKKEDQYCSISLYVENPSTWGGQAVQTKIEEEQLFPFIKEMFGWKEYDYVLPTPFYFDNNEIEILQETFKKLGYEVEHYKFTLKVNPENYIWLRMPITNETLEQKLIELSNTYKEIKHGKISENI